MFKIGGTANIRLRSICWPPDQVCLEGECEHCSESVVMKSLVELQSHTNSVGMVAQIKMERE